MEKRISRREFLKTAGIGVASISFGLNGVSSVASVRPSSSDSFYSSFKAPPASVRPFYRWWWIGNRITEDEIKRELKLIKESGAGGVEINPVDMPQYIDNRTGEPIEWLSDRWNEMVRFTSDEAKKLGLTCDMIVGTGWPFGGEFLEHEEWIQGLEIDITTFDGPQTVRKQVPYEEDDNRKLIQIKLVPLPVYDLNSIINIPLDSVKDGTMKIEIPAGRYDLCIITWRRRFREVRFGAPGADGPVLDHFNKAAVESYLNNMSESLKPNFNDDPGAFFRSMFCDSIELEGANWTGDFSEEFDQRRGYKIEPFLPLIMNHDAELAPEFRDTVLRARYDHSLTLAELFLERFIQPYHEWCHRIGVQSRYQSYGYPWIYTDLLDGYLIPDIPEGDQWLFNSGWMTDVGIDDIRYAVWNKYASSGAHLAGRKITSCEAMTNTKGVFEASLEYIKQATDIDFITGVNHLVLHGFNYSPSEAGFPGWVHFGTYFNENNPWWRYVPDWSDYTSRLSWVFQESTPVVQVGILGPTLDVWSESGLDRNPWITTPWYLHELWQALNHHGYMSDYVNSKILKDADVTDGKLRYGEMTYDVLIVAAVETLESEAAGAIFEYVSNGGKVIFIEHVPYRSPGLIDRDKNDSIVNETIQQALAIEKNNVQSLPEPPKDDLIGWIGKQMQLLGVHPSVQISDPDEKFFCLHKKRKNADIFFLVNSDKNRSLQFEAEFQTRYTNLWRWDPATGDRELYSREQTNRHSLEFSPLESLLLIFEDRKEGRVFRKPQLEQNRRMEIRGPWRVEFQPVRGRNRFKFMNTLGNLVEQDDLQDFAGEVIYQTGFSLNNPEPLMLVLGEVHETAEVIFNGKDLGVKWWGQRQFDLSEVVQPGENELIIKVTTLLFNYCRSLEHSTVADYWIGRSSTESPLPAGLIGPVHLIPYRQ